jgi:hypothetical protein
VWAGVAALTAAVATWHAISVAAGLLIAWSAMGVVAEWQSRRTLLAVLRAAPAGAVTVHRDGQGRQCWSLTWAAGTGRDEPQSRP